MFTAELVQQNIDRNLTHEIHTSERKSFRGCRRRWGWLFRDMYYPRITAKPLEFGAAYHEAMELLYEPSTWDKPRDVVGALSIVRFVEACERQKNQFLRDNDQQYITNEEAEEDYNERVELGKGMLNYYIKTISPEADGGFTPIRVEVGFKVPIKSPTGEYLLCKCDQCWEREVKYYDLLPEFYYRDVWEGLPVVYGGRIDMLALGDDGGLWIYDWKTAAQIRKDMDAFLYLDDQIASYVWALRMMLKLDVRGFIYVEQRKGFPQPPKRNKVVRLGCSFSVSKNQDTDYVTYLKTISEEDTLAWKAGYYDEFLQWLQDEGPKYWHRYQIPKSDAELEETGINIWKEACEMINPDLLMYPNPGRFGCQFCAFREPCLEQNARGDYQYMLDESGMYEKRTLHYWERPLSTDSESR